MAKERLTIVIPNQEARVVNISQSVVAHGSVANKFLQFLKTYEVVRGFVVENTFDRISTQDPFLLAS